MSKNHQNIQSGCLHPSQMFFNDINYGYRAAILKKNYLWLLPFCMTVTTDLYYEKVRRTMCTGIVSYLLNNLGVISM